MRIRLLLVSFALALGLSLFTGVMVSLTQASRDEVDTDARVGLVVSRSAVDTPGVSTDFVLHDAFFSGMSQFMGSGDFVNYPNSGLPYGPPGCVPIAGAEFTFEPARSYPGRPIIFAGTVASGLAPVYTWNFGDGGVGQGVTVTHVFTGYDDHVVAMTAAGDCGQSVARHAVYGPMWVVRPIQPGHSVASFPKLVAHGSRYHLLWIESQAGDLKLYYASRELAGDWSAPQLVNVQNTTVSANSRPALAVASNGWAYAVWADADYVLQSAFLQPGATDWTYFEPVSDGLAWNPALAVDGNDNVYAAWREMAENGDHIYFAKYAFHDADSWSDKIKINDEGVVTDQDSPTLASTTAGLVTVAWADNRTQTSSDIYYDSLDAGVAHWVPTSFDPWNAPVHRPNIADQFDPVLALASEGTLYVAWLDGRNRGDQDDNWDIYSARLIPGANRWEREVRVNDDPVSAGQVGAGQGAPALASDDRGHFYAVWMDGRYLDLEGGWGIVASSVSAPARTWTKNQRVDVTDDAVLGQWPAIASDADGNLAVVWRGLVGEDLPRLYEATQPGSPVLQSVTPATVDNTWGESWWLHGVPSSEVIVVHGENFVQPSVELDGVPLIVVASSSHAITAALSQPIAPETYSLTVLNRDVRPSNTLPFAVTNHLDHFGLSTVNNQVVGVPFPLTVQALDKYGLPVVSYAVSPTLTDLTNTLIPATAGPFVQGEWTRPVTISQAINADWITVADGAISSQTPLFAVIAPPAGLDHFAVAVSTPVVAGQPFTTTVTAQDVNNVTVTGYTASNTLIISTGAITPTQTGNFAVGVWTGQVRVTTAGTLTLTTQGGGKTGASAPFAVLPGPLEHFELTPLPAGQFKQSPAQIRPATSPTQTAGVDFTLVITAADHYGNPALFDGTAVLTDTTATISPAIAGPFVQGRWSGNVHITQAASGVVISIFGEGMTNQSQALVVQPAPMAQYAVYPSSPHGRAGVGLPVVVEALDAYGNFVEGGNGTLVTLASTLPGLIYADNPVVLSAGRAGTVVTTTVAAEGTLSAADQQGHSGTSAPVTIDPAAVETVSLAPPQVTLAPYTSEAFTAEAFDAYGNGIPEADLAWDVIAGGGMIDGQGVFVAGAEAGAYPDTVQVTTAWLGSAQSARASVEVIRGPLAQVSITPDSATLPLAGQQDFEAQGYDAYGNTIPNLAYAWSVTPPAGAINQSGLFQAGTVAGQFDNAIVVHADAFSNTASVIVQPGPAAQAHVTAEPRELLADGQSQSVLTVCLADAYDNAVADDTPVDVSVDLGLLGWSGNTIAGCTTRLLTAPDTPGTGHVVVAGVPASGDTAIVYRHLPPTVSIGASPRLGAVPLTVTFVPTTTGVITGYLWLFDDGNTSQEIAPTHVYTAAGVYYPALVVSGPGGSATDALPLVAEEAIAGLAAINDSPTPLGQLTTLTATVAAGTNISFTWRLGDGGLGAGTVITHAYPIGIYTATVAARNFVSAITSTTTVTVDAAIAGLSAINDSPTQLGSATTLTATITGGSNVTFAWAFGDGATGSGPTVSHAYPAIGAYTAVVTATNSVGVAATTTTVTIAGECYDFQPPVGVDAGDILVVAVRWGLTAQNPDPDQDPNTPNYEPQFDVTHNGIIDIVDIMTVAGHWGEMCQ